MIGPVERHRPDLVDPIQFALLTVGLVGVGIPLYQIEGQRAVVIAVVAAALWGVSAAPYSYAFLQFVGGGMLAGASVQLLVAFQTGALVLLFGPTFVMNRSLRAVAIGLIVFIELVAVVLLGTREIGIWIVAISLCSILTAGIYLYVRQSEISAVSREES